MAELARTLDRAALDDDPGARVRLALVVPPGWAREGATVRVVAPVRVVCARCDGGGCDGCARAGAFKLDPSVDARAFELTLPTGLATGLELRVARPFGDDSPITQALCAVRLGDDPIGCTRVDRRVTRSAAGTTARWPALAALALGVALVGWLTAWLAGSR